MVKGMRGEGVRVKGKDQEGGGWRVEGGCLLITVIDDTNDLIQLMKRGLPKKNKISLCLFAFAFVSYVFMSLCLYVFMSYVLCLMSYVLCLMSYVFMSLCLYVFMS